MREKKDSGISWVGEIPKEWSVWRNKYIFKMTKDIVLPSKNYQLLSLTTTGIKEKDENDNGGKVPENYDGYQVIKENDLVMCLFDLDCSAVFSGLSPYNGMISPAYKVLKVKKRIANEQYYRYWFNYVGSKRFYKQYSKSLRFTLNADEFNRLFSLLPPLDEQQRIAEFLDRACGKIDGLKADIQAQIDTLEQYKRSVITEAVTHGLNPSAPMKDSGVDYIDKIKSDWRITKIGFVCSKLTRGFSAEDPALICSNNGSVMLRDEEKACGKMVSEDNAMQGIHIGDIAIHGMDTWHGAIGFSKIKGKITRVVHVCDSTEDKRFIVYYLKSLAYQNVYKLISNGVRGNTSDFRSWDKVKDIYICLPATKKEENEICDYLDAKCENIDMIIADKKTQIETLDGYKKSLIYEYVTGKKEVG